jgi:molybdate transport system substrate-binding protein
MTPPRAFLITSLAVGLGAHPIHAQASPSPARLTVFAAASLTDPFQELGKRLEHRRPGLKVAFNFAGSQQLAVQIQEGAPADVFASADDRWMTYAKDSGFVAGEPRTFTRNRLVVIIPQTNPARIGRLQDLARPGVKLVLAAPAVPVGAYARLMFNNLSRAPGFSADYGQHALSNVVSQEQNVKAVVSKVQLGEADAGVVYVSDVISAVSRFVKAIDIPEGANVVAQYPIALVTNAPNAAAAQAFVDLVTSPEGQAILQKYQFLPIGPR